MDLWSSAASVSKAMLGGGGLDCFHHCSVLMRKRIEWDEKSELGREHNTNIESGLSTRPKVNDSTYIETF